MLKLNLNHLFEEDFVEHLDNVQNVLNNQIHVEIDKNLKFHLVLNDNESKLNQFLHVLFEVQDKD